MKKTESWIIYYMDFFWISDVKKNLKELREILSFRDRISACLAKIVVNT